MKLFSWLILVAINGAYLFISFNMDLMYVDERDTEIEEIVATSTTLAKLDPSDILDLPIFDFDTEELDSSQEYAAQMSLLVKRDEVSG